MPPALPPMTPQHLQMLEQHPHMRQTLLDALDWLEEREPHWNLDHKIDRSIFAQNLIDQLHLEQTR